MRKSLIILLAVITVVIFGYTNRLKKKTLPPLAANTIIVATSADNPPYEFLNQQNIVGIDVAIIQEVAQRLGYNVQLQNLDFPSLIPSLQAGKVNVVIAGLTSTAERANYIDFSVPYLTTNLAVLYMPANHSIDTINDLVGKKLGVQTGTPLEQWANSLNAPNAALTVKSMISNLTLIEELKNGNIDAVVLEKHQALAFAANIAGTSVLDVPTVTFDLAIAVAKGDPLANKINEALKQMSLPVSATDSRSQIQAICDTYTTTNQ